MLNKLATVAVAAAFALSAPGRQAEAQKVLVYCPVGIDGTGCDRIVNALQPKFSEGVDRGYDGSNGTIDLKAADLQHYAVFVVPSLADDADKQPYALLRAVAPRLHYAINGRVAVYSGAPDQGSSNRSDKDALIQNLTRWAASGHTRKVSLVGLVAFLDLSEKEADRYSWVRSISLVDVSADAEVQSVSDATVVSKRGGNLLSVGGRPLAFSNMASNGLHVGSRAAARTEVGAMIGTTSRQAVLVTYANADGPDENGSDGSASQAASTGASFNRVSTAGSPSFSTSSTTSTASTTWTPKLSTDKPDYLPGDTVTFTGAGFAPGDTVRIDVHEDPTWSYPDREFTSMADANGAFTNRQMVVDKQDLGATFMATALGTLSGVPAQVTFTDGNLQTVTLTPASVSVAAGQTASYGLSVKVNTNNGACPFTLSVSPSLPAGLSASFSPSNSSAGTEDFSGTLTVGTSTTTPAGSTTFTVLATKGGACAGGSNQTATGTLVVTSSGTTTTLASSLTPSVFGQSVTFTATVTPSPGNVGTATFKDGTVDLCTGVALLNGQATCTTAGLAVSTPTGHSITAVYSGGTGFGGSSSTALSQVVNKAQPVFSGLSAPAVTYDPTATNATISGALKAGTLIPTGAVAVSIAGTGGALTGSGTLDPSGNFTANITGASLPANATGYAIALSYAATTNFADANDNTLKLIVNRKSVGLSATVGTLTYNGSAQGPTFTGDVSQVTLSYSGTNGTTYGPSTTQPSNAGSYSWKATLADANNYQFAGTATTTGTFAIAKAAGAVSFTSTNPGTLVFNGTYAVTTTKTGDGTVTLAVGTSDACTIANGTVTMTSGTGNCTVTATLGEGTNYSGGSAMQTFTASKAAATIALTAADLNQIYSGTAKVVGATTAPSGLTVLSVSYSQGGTTVAAPTNAGSYDVKATLVNANFQAADATGTLVIAKKPVSLSASVGTLTFNNAPQGPSFTGDVAHVAINYSGVSPTSYGPSTTQPTNAGSYSWMATLLDANNYEFGNGVAMTGAFAIAKADQAPLSITGVPATVTFGDAKFSLGASGGSGAGALAWSTSSTACSINATSGEVTVIAAGSCAVSLTKAGGINFNDAVANTNFQIQKKSVSLTVSVGTLTYNGSAQGPTFTGDLAQVDISYIGTSGTTYGSASAQPANAGSYSWLATLKDAANYQFAMGANYKGTFSIAKAQGSVTITSTNPGTLVFNGTYSVTTDKTGDGTVTLSHGATDVCTVSGNTVTMTSGTGSCTVTATLSEGQNYLGASTAQTFTATKAAATITLTSADLNQIYSGSPKTVSFTTSPSGLAVVTASYSQGGTAVSAPTNAGSYDVKATLVNPNYAAPDATGTLVIAKKPVSLIATGTAFTYNTNPQGPSLTGDLTQVSISYGGVSPTSYGPSATQPTNAGSYSWTAALLDANNYVFATGVATTGTFSIAKANQSITGFNLASLSKTYGDPAFSVASGVSGGASGKPVAFVLGTGSLGCTVTAAGQVTITGATGSSKCVITASQDGNDNYNPATPLSQSFSIAKATPIISWTPASPVQQGTPFGAAQKNATAAYSGGTVAGTFSYSIADGTLLVDASYSPMVTFTPTDGNNFNGATLSQTIVITNVDPYNLAINVPTPLALKSALTVTGSFTDPGGSADGHIVTFTWYLGTALVSGVPSTTTATVTYNGASATFSATRSDLPVGVYTVHVAVVDRYSGHIEGDAKYAVVFDPTGGFVTGGGWITAATGSCTAGAPAGVCTNATGGRANFGFVSKYQKGATAPSGNTEFQFQAGNLNFNSTSYSWLVISGPQAQYKGKGTINGGTTQYDFILTAVDGSVSGGGGTDKFRIKIMDPTSGQVVFDNQLNADDSAAPVTTLGGGSIQIQSK